MCAGEEKRGKKVETARSTPVPPGPRAPPTLLHPHWQRCGSLTCGALAEERVDLVDTLAVVQAGAVFALVRIDLAHLPLVAWPISKEGPGGRWIG